MMGNMKPKVLGQYFQLETRGNMSWNDVLYVLGLKKNLVSTSSLEDKGYKVAFFEGQVFIWKRGSSIDSAKVIGVRE